MVLLPIIILPDSIHKHFEGIMNTLKQKLKVMGKSLGWLSKEAKISRHHLSNIANNKCLPRIDTAYKIAKAMGCNIENIWIFKD